MSGNEEFETYEVVRPVRWKNTLRTIGKSIGDMPSDTVASLIACGALKIHTTTEAPVTGEANDVQESANVAGTGSAGATSDPVSTGSDDADSNGDNEPTPSEAISGGQSSTDADNASGAALDDDRMAKIVDAIGQLDKENPEHFTNGGKPEVRAIAKVISGPLTAEERDNAWQSIQQKESAD